MNDTKALDLVGQRFGRLTVIERCGSRYGRASWRCRCDCGNEIIATSGNLVERTRSCGCYQKDRAKESQTLHGMAHTKINFIWIAMKQRCSNPKNQGFKNYGGRGIKVCQEWQDSFEAFYDYVSQLPHFGEPGYSLDRINNDGNYEPGNVKWSTKTEQNQNRRKVKHYGIKG